jgi:phage terminase small subunit
MTRGEVMDTLLKAKNKPERAALYCDSFLEYKAAQENIDRNGAIVSDARTGGAVPNPFLAVRDKAFARLEALHKAGVRSSDLW